MHGFPLLSAGLTSTIQQRKLEEMQSKLLVAETRAMEAERTAELAEADAKEKDIELSEALNHLRMYESVSIAHTPLCFPLYHCV